MKMRPNPDLFFYFGKDIIRSSLVNPRYDIMKNVKFVGN